MSVSPQLKRMHLAGVPPRAGSHCSDGMSVDSDWHFHDMHQLLYAFEGAVEVESARGRHLIPRQLAAWIPAGVAHRTSIHHVRSGSVFFPPTMVANAGDDVRTLLVSTLMREMIRESMRWPFQAPESHVAEAFFGAMAKLCEEWILHEARLLLPRSHDPRLNRVLETTAQRPRATLATVCRQVGISERSLRRRLKRDLGMTWEAYRRHARLLRAIAMLGDADAPVSEIAARCGFESPSAFAKAFRRAMGETPSHYRDRALDPL